MIRDFSDFTNRKTCASLLPDDYQLVSKIPENTTMNEVYYNLKLSVDVIVDQRKGRSLTKEREVQEGQKHV